MIKQFEEEYIPLDTDKENPNNFHHHDRGLSAQKNFQIQVESICKTINAMGNPFFDDFPNLVNRDSRSCADETVVETVRNLVDIGKRQYQDFVKNVLIDRTQSIHDPIKKTSTALFNKQKQKGVSKPAKKVKMLQNNVELYLSNYIHVHAEPGI